jgi:hypothetical protein
MYKWYDWKSKQGLYPPVSNLMNCGFSTILARFSTLLTKRLIVISLLSLLGLVLFTATPSHAMERRCGWIANPTPGNWFLLDSAGSWMMSAQGGRQARGFDTIPDLSQRDYLPSWVSPNRGYACACMDVTTNRNPRDKWILSLRNFKQLPINQCRRDRALPRPE